MSKPLIGVEITEESVRAVEVTRSRNPHIIAAGEVALPPDAARDSEVLDQDAVAMALRQLWIRAGFKGRNVVLGVSSRRILVREHSSQLMAPELLKQALPYQVQDLLPVPVEQAVLDFYPVAESTGMVHGLLVSAVSETIEGLISACTRARLVVDAVDLSPFGLARVAKALGAAGETTAMVHLGDHTTSVVIASDGVPQFVRILAGDIPTAAVQARADVPGEQAGDGPDGHDDDQPAVPYLRGRAALRAAQSADEEVTDLVNRIQHTIAFHENRPGSAPVSTVRVSGAGYTAAGVSSALSSTLRRPIVPITADDIVGGRSVEFATPEAALNLVSTAGVLLEGGY